MAEDDKGRLSAVEAVALVVVVAFAVTVLFGLMSAVAGAVWWIVKMILLVVVLFVAVRWVARRSTR